MLTSYFAVAGSLKNAVSIAGKAPDGYKGKEYKKLAPSWKIYSTWKNSKQTEQDKLDYEKAFRESILGKLDAKEVYKELGENAILICYEKSGDFCHRRIVAEWLKENLNVEVEELSRKDINRTELEEELAALEDGYRAVQREAQGKYKNDRWYAGVKTRERHLLDCIRQIRQRIGNLK